MASVLEGVQGPGPLVGDRRADGGHAARRPRRRRRQGGAAGRRSAPRHRRVRRLDPRSAQRRARPEGRGGPGDVPRARVRRRRRPGDRSRRAPRVGSASTPRPCSPRTRGWCTAPSPRTARIRRTAIARAGTRWSRPASVCSHEQRGHLGGAVPHMNGDEPYLPDLEIPDGMEPGSPRSGPIFTYTPWPSMCGRVPRHRRASTPRSWPRERTGRGQHVETSLLQAAFSLTASKWQRAEHNDPPGYRTWIYDRRAPKGFFRCSDDRWIEQWVPNPSFALSSADGDTLALRRDVDRVRDDPDRVPPDPENIIVLAHYYPEMAEAFARFPSDDWVRVGRGRRRSPPAGAHARGGAARPDARSRRRGRRRADTPTTARSARSASSTASARRRDGSRDRCPHVGADTGTSLPMHAPVRRRRPSRAAATHDTRPPLDGHRGARPRVRGRRSVRHPGPRRPRRHRHQGERHPRPVVARQPHRLRRQPRQAQHRHRPQEPRRPRGAAPTRRARRRRALQHAPRRARGACTATKSRCARSIPTSCTATPVASTVARAATRPATTRPAAPSPASPTRTAAAATAGDRSGASRHSATPATGSCPRSA